MSQLKDNKDTIVAGYSRKLPPSLQESMKVFLREEFQNIETSIRTLVEACPQVTNKEPESPRRGMVRYAVSPWNPLGNAYEGLVVYNGTTWVEV